MNVEEIDFRLPDFDDWQVLLALHHHARPWDGMVTNDTSMLDQPRELATLGYTQLTLVAPQAAGHDPIRSTGLVLDEPHRGHRGSNDVAQAADLEAQPPDPRR